MTKTPTTKSEPTYAVATVCEIANVKARTLQAWRLRGILELERKDQLERHRNAARKLKDEMEAAGEDASWVEDTLGRMEQQRAPTPYTFSDLLRVVALAELSRYGLSPASFKSLAVAVANDMSQQTPKQASKKPRYLIAASFQQDDGGGRGLGVVPEMIREGTVLLETAASPERLKYFLSVNLADDSMGFGASAFVVDTAKLLRGILGKLAALGEAIPGEELKP